MNCPNCGALNEAGRKFCGECGNRLAVACPNCGTANAPGTRFCGECGTALDAGATAAGSAGAGAGATRGAGGPFDAMGRVFAGGPVAGGPSAGGPVAGGPLAERRLVTVLFADLVGFTTISEGRDHEEVRELLSRYFDVAREQIERYGGTVEKFIGDAVMAVWGAPTAHEDDAERAVRAALEVVDSVKSLAPELQARAGVLTGEAAVTVGARGQGMVAGDLVNTASRLQSVAPPGMVLVGESTRRATSDAVAFEPAGEHVLKGKAAPVTAYRALRIVAGRGGRGRADRLEAPFVGRDSELRLLKDLYHATAREKRVRLVSITGQAGVGKSRLSWELSKYADGIATDVFWHEGRSPAYGSGITFWALGEMVRARAQLTETDDPATTRAKLATSVARWFPEGAERDRVERALQTLLGVSDAPSGGAGELFGAWRLYFERMAAEDMVILVFEDLHWADAGQLDFIDHVLEWSRDVPILIITQARPELLDRRPDWGAGRRNFLALDLQPLDEDSMRELLAGFVPGLSDAAVRSIVARAEGIPLYAVETIRMLVAEGRLRERAEGGFEPVGELGDLAVPDSLHALIAARLDSLEPADRSLIQDASVLGQSFIPAGLAAISGVDEGTLLGRLRELVKADLLREERDERSPERGQFAFVQALIREVAYSTLSLKDRRTRHLAAARFFEAIGDDELAGVLAVHYLAAHRATPDGDEAAPLAIQARIALRAAADRASALGSAAQAVSFLEQALVVTTDESEQADILEGAGLAANAAAHQEHAEELLVRAQSIREGLGDRIGLARVMSLRAEALFLIPQREAAIALGEAGIEQFADIADEPEVVRLRTGLAIGYSSMGHYDRALEEARRALASAERLGNVELTALNLLTLGTMAFYQGRLWEARALGEGSLKLAREHDLKEVELLVNNQLTNILALDDPRATLEVERETIALARRLGMRTRETVVLANAAEDARRTGDWDWAVDELRSTRANDVDDSVRMMIDEGLAFYQIVREGSDERVLEPFVAAVAQVRDRDVSSGVMDLRGYVAAVHGDWATALAQWREQAAVSDLNKPYALPKAGYAAVMAGQADAARRVLEDLAALGARGRAIEADQVQIAAGIAALEGDEGSSMSGYRTALAAYRDLGLVWDEALLGLSAATRLGTTNPEVRAWLEGARQTLSRLGAIHHLAMVEALLNSPAAGAQTLREPRATSEGQPAESVSST